MHTFIDYSLFTKSRANCFTYLLVYVDDLVLASNDLTEILNSKALFHCKFRIKDLWPLWHFLGLEVARSQSGILINQHYYTLDILKKQVCLLLNHPLLRIFSPSIFTLFHLHLTTTPLNTDDLLTYLFNKHMIRHFLCCSTT